ncbi:MAG: glycosyltransferase, partial [Patescibacteria group bacterium]
VDLHYKFIGGTNDDEPASENFIVDDLREDMGSMRMPQVTLSTGKNCFSNSGDFKIGFTTTEVNGIPRDWVKVLNEMNEVWTTSEFSKKGFEKSGVKPPIFNMREGINPEYFHPDILPFEHAHKDKFVFISNFAWGRRKGIEELFEAYSREFSRGEKVIMILKVLPSYHNANIQEDMKKLFSRKGEAEIIVWDAVLPPYMLPSFYRAGDCMVFPTRGEGFGLPPLEALACGVPVITTGYSAQTEYLKKDGEKLPGVEFIDFKMGKFDGSDSIYYKGFDWALPDVKHLQKLMRKVFDNREKYKADALESSKWIRQEWSWAKAADLVIERLKEIQK